MPRRPWKNEYTLLCERCGYVLEGLDQAGNCPECGKPIAESLPERRVGTPWQQRPGVGSLLATWWMTLRHPLRTLDVMRVGSRQNTRWLSWWTIGVAALFSATGYVLSTLLHSTEPLNSSPFITALTIPLWMILPTMLLALLTWIETRGLVIIARTRGFRVDKHLARSITAHGAVGWLIAGILFAVLFNISGLFVKVMTPETRRITVQITTPGTEETPDTDLGTIEAKSTRQGNTESITTVAPTRGSIQTVSIKNAAKNWVYWIAWSLWGLGLLIGFLFFETFAYLGLRRCKYANRVRPDAT